MSTEWMRPEDAQSSAEVVRHDILVVVATVAFWLFMFGLLSSPAWLPGLVDRLIISH